MEQKVISIWSDGSSHNSGEFKGVGGYGAVLIYSKLPTSEEELHGEYAEEHDILKIYGGADPTTNQQMEVQSIVEALKRIKNFDKPIHVFSDSAYLVNCMNRKWYQGWLTNGWRNSQKKPVANKEQWQELLKFIMDGFLDITWTHKKSHIGIFYNEMADDLARMGMEEAKQKRLTNA